MCDPVHGIMDFEDNIKDIIKPLIDTAYFQRLRHIKQLSFVEYAYPGAVHTRFNHCIGVAYLANRVAKVLKLSPDEQEKVVVAGLLHDIGHGPFSHAFESIYGDAKKISHEEWNRKFLANLVGLPQFETNIKLKNLINYADNILSNLEEGILHQIVSSQLDVDRFDYLLRDSHFCGVSYGHFEIDWLISCLQRDDGKIVIVPKGVKAVEHYVMARRLMHHNVYLHKKSSGASYLLRILFEQLKKEINNDILAKFDSDFLNFVRLVNDNIELDEDEFQKKIIDDGFEIYSKLTEHDVWILIQKLSRSQIPLLNEISNRFLTRQLPEVIHIKDESHEYVKELIKELRNNLDECEKWRLFYDDESKIKIYESNIDDTYVQEISVVDNEIKGSPGSDDLKSHRSVVSYSNIINALSDKKDRVGYIYYCKPEESFKNNGYKNIDKTIEELYNNHCCYSKPKIMNDV